MSGNMMKLTQSVSPVRAGAGDISERGLSRERTRLTTPPARVQPAHPKKLFSTPVSKFTGRRMPPSPDFSRIRSCLDEYTRRAPATPARVRPKAASMEDLTPNKRHKKERGTKDAGPAMPRSPRRLGVSEAQAAARISRFMLVATWRRRKEEIFNLRKTLESKRSCSDRLRVQVWVLKSLLDSDNAKVVLAMRELERLKQLLREKDLEKAVLDREKVALERDVSAIEDRASELSIGWRNTRNELDAVRASLERGERERGLERAAAAEARAQRDHAYTRINLLEEELTQHEMLLTGAEAEVLALRREADEREQMLNHTAERLRAEQEARCRCALECSSLKTRAAAAAREAAELRALLARLEAELRRTREQLDWWPRPLTKMLGAARSLFRRPMSVPEAIFWSLIPTRHGC